MNDKDKKTVENLAHEIAERVYIECGGESIPLIKPVIERVLQNHLSLVSDSAGNRARIAELQNALIEQANQLDNWAEQSGRGGWSTHQVEPMKKKANELRRIATRR